MRDARALLASVGTSALLIAAVVVTLLSVTLVFAIGGVQNADAIDSSSALVLQVADSGKAPRARSAAPQTPLVAPTPAPRGRSRAQRPAGRADNVRSDAPGETSVSASSPQDGDSGAGTGSGPDDTPAPAPASAHKPNLGDGVKKLGDDLSSTVTQTGATLAQVTAPLGPPVSAAVQQVLNVVAAIVQQTTNALGGLLGAQSGR
jgi:hypothetical protein